MSAPGLKLLVNGIQFEHAFSSAVFEAPDSEVTSTPKRPLKWQTTSLGRLWKWDWLPILKDQWFELLKNQVRKCGIWVISQDMSRPNSVRWCKSQRHLSRCGLLMSTIGFFELQPKGARGALIQYQPSKQNQWKAMGQVHHLQCASQFHLSLQWLILSCNLWWSEEIWYDWYDLLPALIIQKNGGSMRFGCWKSHQDPYQKYLYTLRNIGSQFPPFSVRFVTAEHDRTLRKLLIHRIVHHRAVPGLEDTSSIQLFVEMLWDKVGHRWRKKSWVINVDRHFPH